MAAGREAKRRLHTAFREKRSILQETTLSGRGIFREVEKATKLGFYIELHYIGLSRWEMCRNRVDERVLQGGHE